MKILWISDFFKENNVLGGAELVDHNVIDEISNRGIEVVKINSSMITPSVIDNVGSDHIIVSNFVYLNINSMEHLIKSKEYSILEHDHKYLKSRNPSEYYDNVAPLEDIVNSHFYEYAQNVFCQTTKHLEVIKSNITLDNLVNLSGSVWSKDELQILKDNLNQPKTIEYAVLDSDNPSKNSQLSARYCKHNDISFKAIGNSDYSAFINQLSRSKNLVFFPKTIESCCRLAVEARIVNCNLITNENIGASYEKWFGLKGIELLSKVSEISHDYINTIIRSVTPSLSCEYRSQVESPKVSVLIPIEGKKIPIDSIKSVLSQTEDKIHVHLVTDTKEALPVLKDLFSPDSRVFSHLLPPDTNKFEYFKKICKSKAASWLVGNNTLYKDAIEKMLKLLQANDLDLVFSSFRDQRHALNWRSYNLDSDNIIRNPHGFIDNRSFTTNSFTINDWLELNIDLNHLGPNILFNMSILKPTDILSAIDNQEHHASIMMFLEAKRRAGYIDEPLGSRKFSSQELFRHTERATFAQTHQLTKNLINKNIKEKV